MEINKLNDGSILLTAPVMIPGVPDCDYTRGEPPLTVEQVKGFKESYNDYQFVDSEHELTRNGRKIGEAKSSYLLPEDTNLTLSDGRVKKYPRGTWMLTTHITENEAIKTALDGGYSGYSATVRNKLLADDFLSSFKSQLESGEDISLKSYSRANLIKDIKDPVVLSVSLVKRPCQTGSQFCKIKNNHGENMSDDISNFKRKVLTAMGMSEEAEVEALKSQIDTLDSKLEDMENKYNEALKGMKDELTKAFTDSLKEALSEPFSDKSQKKNKKEESEEDDESVDESNNGSTDESTESTEEEEEEEEETKVKKTGSKQGKTHNNMKKSDKSQIEDTYAFLGRNPDGTRQKTTQ